MILSRDILGRESKIHSQSGRELLRTILRKWMQGNCIPLFVSEGTSPQKVHAIEGSNYLSTIYKEVIPSLSRSLTVYGWGFGYNDAHILNKIGRNSLDRIAISVYRDGNEQDFCSRVEGQIRRYLGRNIEVLFFDCNSSGCWNNP